MCNFSVILHGFVSAFPIILVRWQKKYKKEFYTNVYEELIENETNQSANIFFFKNSKMK